MRPKSRRCGHGTQGRLVALRMAQRTYSWLPTIAGAQSGKQMRFASRMRKRTRCPTRSFGNHNSRANAVAGVLRPPMSSSIGCTKDQGQSKRARVIRPTGSLFNSKSADQQILSMVYDARALIPETTYILYMGISFTALISSPATERHDEGRSSHTSGVPIGLPVYIFRSDP